MKRNSIRNIVGGLSFTSALFIFQACYGTPQDLMHDMLVQGKVTSGSTELPIEGIKVTIAETEQFQYTDSEGKFNMYTLLLDSLALKFRDVDASENGSFADLDTIVSGDSESVYLNVALEEK